MNNNNNYNKNLALIRAKIWRRFNLVSVPLIAIWIIYFNNKTIFNKIISFELPTNEIKEISLLPMLKNNKKNLKQNLNIYYFLIIVSISIISKLFFI